jgi:hypothetical protein
MVSRWRWLVAVGSIAVVVTAVVTLVMPSGGFSSGTTPSETPPIVSSSSTSTNTPPSSIVASTFDDAVRLWKGIFNVHGSTLVIAHVDSASYVETTLGQARAMLEPNRPGELSVPDSSLVWVIVAYGQFEPFVMGITDPTPVAFTTAWAAPVEGGIDAENGYDDRQYDLSQLGTPHDLDPAVLNSAD